MIKFLTYQNCKDLTMRDLPSIKETGRRLETNVWLVVHEECFAVRLHNTEILEIYPDKYRLYNGNWRTKLTSTKLSKYSPVNIFSLKKKWRWYYKGDTHQNINMFEEGMEIYLHDVIEHMAEYLL